MRSISNALPAGIRMLFLWFLILQCNLSFARTETAEKSKLIINHIRIDGNKQTRSKIIFRELLFHEQDTLPLSDLPFLVQKSRENIFNTHLFNFVTLDTLSIPGVPGRIDVAIHVIERWYIWPWPFFEIADRNVSTWLRTMNMSRLTYGIDLTINNVRGCNETLTFPFHAGFNQKYGFHYLIPFLDRKQTLGLSFGADLERNHEVIVGSKDNKTVFLKQTDCYSRQNLYSFAELVYRPTIYSRHYFRVFYQYYYFSDSILTVPDYGVKNRKEFGFTGIYYKYKNDHRDVQFYPLKGYYFDIEFLKNGVFHEPVNYCYVKSSIRKYWQVYHRWYFATGITGKVTLTPDPPYFLQQGLGYGRDFVRGYEYYVIDGRNYVVFKNNLKFAIVPPGIFIMDFLKSRKFNTVPYALYMNVFLDLGYEYNQSMLANQKNDLQNSILAGYGVGFDFTTYYDVVIRADLSMNGKGQPGVYLHFIAPI
ncbi:MAG: hypothetical protein Q8867_00190 [Bacteroidota bacterium]|nr:hypothetical protein [Bacteroidota bacterium]